jgi:hypothetical protein
MCIAHFCLHLHTLSKVIQQNLSTNISHNEFRKRTKKLKKYKRVTQQCTTELLLSQDKKPACIAYFINTKKLFKTD